MKLIVDVEKDYYEIIKYNVEQGQKYKPWEIIANGIPYEERPQGEWVENLMHSTICSNCGGIRRDNRVDYIAFCNKCGADMRGGAE